MRPLLEILKRLSLVLVLLLAVVLPMSAQDAIVVAQDEHEHVFQKSLTFRLTATSSSKISTIKLFYRVSGQTSANKVELDFEPDKDVSVEHTVDMADETNYQPPMIEFTYWWLITDEEDHRLKTEPVTFVYEDTTYVWQVLEEELLRLYWHEQDQQFGQRFFDLAVQTASSLHDEFGVQVPRPVQIVIYNSHQELMAVLHEGSAEWTGAVTFGETGVIAIGLGPMAWMDKVIPHELTHATLYMITTPPFGDIPRWLHEGLAMRSEGGMGQEEESALAEAIKSDTLVSLRVLNSAFADQRDQAILSYAESNSLVSFIIEEYGTEKLGELLAVFAKGAHYDDAMIQVFGVDMDGVEDLWRAYIGAKPRTGTTRATPAPGPTLTLTPTQVPSIQATATPKAKPGSSPTAVASLPTATPTLQLDPTPTALSAPTATPVPTRSGPCLGALPAMALLALFLAFRPRSVRPG